MHGATINIPYTTLIWSLQNVFVCKTSRHFNAACSGVYNSHSLMWPLRAPRCFCCN